MNQNIYQYKRLVNGAMNSITEIIWPLFRRAQLYDQDILAVKIDFGETGVHQIDIDEHGCTTSSKILLWNS
jgi:hypothetical protein